MRFYHSSVSLKPGDEVAVIPEELVAGGAALARIDGFPVFIMKLLPGDEALVRLTEVKSGFARAELVELRTPSALRRAQPCPVAEECGGCDWTALRLDHQLTAKERILVESLRRIGKQDPGTLPPISLHASPLNYRLRSRLQIREGMAGFFALRTRRVVPLPDECEVVGPGVIRHLDELRKGAHTIREGEILTLEHDAVFTTGRNAATTIEVRGFRYAITTETFFQVNRHLLGTLLDLATQCAEETPRRRRALDLFSGVGFFTLPLSKRFGEVIGVEEFGPSHQVAVANATSFPNVKLIHGPVERFMKRSPHEVDFILIDPPRTGASPEVLEAISNSSAAHLGYLSCDPVTFSRDVLRLVRRGWSLSRLDLVDLFPNTHHIETFASFQREGAHPR